MNGYTYLAEALEFYGVDHVFFVPAILIPALAEMEGRGITRVMAHDEKSATYMADGWARASGRAGVCLSQTAGAASVAAGLQDAYLTGSPVIAITGGRLPDTKYRHEYQEVDAFRMFEPVTKFNAEVDNARRLPDLLRQAFRVATTGAPGPVHIQLPGASGAIDGDVYLEGVPVGEAQYSAYPAVRPEPDLAVVREALSYLQAAKRPVIVAGGGVRSSGAQDALLEFAESNSIPVGTSLNAKGVFPEGHRLSIGIVGMYARGSANKVLGEADLVFYIGSRTGAQVTSTWQVPEVGASTVLQADIDASELGRNYPNAVSLLGDARAILRRLVEHIESRPVRNEWTDHVAALSSDWRERKAALLASDAMPIRPERICRELQSFLPERGVIVSETGHATMWTGTCVELRPPQMYLRAAGTLGWAFPASLGVKCALPERTVVCFTGDGGFYYHLSELETAARFGINVVVVVNNNSSMNQEMGYFESAYGGAQTESAKKMWQFKPVDFARIANDLGCAGYRVERPSDIGQALREASVAGRPAVVDIMSDMMAFSDLA